MNKLVRLEDWSQWSIEQGTDQRLPANTLYVYRGCLDRRRDGCENADGTKLDTFGINAYKMVQRVVFNIDPFHRKTEYTEFRCIFLTMCKNHVWRGNGASERCGESSGEQHQVSY